LGSAATFEATVTDSLHRAKTREVVSPAMPQTAEVSLWQIFRHGCD